MSGITLNNAQLMNIMQGAFARLYWSYLGRQLNDKGLPIKNNSDWLLLKGTTPRYLQAFKTAHLALINASLNATSTDTLDPAAMLMAVGNLLKALHKVKVKGHQGLVLTHTVDLLKQAFDLCGRAMQAADDNQASIDSRVYDFLTGAFDYRSMSAVYDRNRKTEKAQSHRANDDSDVSDDDSDIGADDSHRKRTPLMPQDPLNRFAPMSTSATQSNTYGAIADETDSTADEKDALKAVNQNLCYALLASLERVMVLLKEPKNNDSDEKPSLAFRLYRRLNKLRESLADRLKYNALPSENDIPAIINSLRQIVRETEVHIVGILYPAITLIGQDNQKMEGVDAEATFRHRDNVSHCLKLPKDENAPQGLPMGRNLTRIFRAFESVFKDWGCQDWRTLIHDYQEARGRVHAQYNVSAAQLTTVQTGYESDNDFVSGYSL